MLNLQSKLTLKDNSKILSVKVINIYKKKYIKVNHSFLGVIKTSNSPFLNNGKLMNFLATNTKKKLQTFSGRYKKSDQNFCISLKDKFASDPVGSRFIGFFFSEMKNNKSQKLKNLLNQCI